MPRKSNHTKRGRNRKLCPSQPSVSKYICPCNKNQAGGKNENIFARYFNKTKNSQKGAGYTLKMQDPGAFGNQPEYVGYPDSAQPALLNGKMIMSKGCEPVCSGYSHSQSGGKKRKSKKPSKSRKSRKSCSGGSKRNGHKKSHKRSKSLRKRRRTKKQSGKQSGGEASVYSANMNDRQFGCRQPTWGTACI